MGVEAVKFLVDVDLSRQHGHFLLQPAGVEILRQAFDAIEQLLAQAFANFRQPAADFSHPVGDAIQALAEGLFQLLAFTPARLVEFGGGLAQEFEGGFLQRARVLRLLGNHAGPAQHVHHRRAALLAFKRLQL